MSIWRLTEALRDNGINLALVGNMIEISGGANEAQQMLVAVNRTEIKRLLGIYNRGLANGGDSLGTCMSEKFAAGQMQFLSAGYSGDDKTAYEDGYLMGMFEVRSTMTSREALETCRHGSCKDWRDMVRAFRNDGHSDVQATTVAVSTVCRKRCKRDVI